MTVNPKFLEEFEYYERNYIPNMITVFIIGLILGMALGAFLLMWLMWG